MSNGDNFAKYFISFVFLCLGCVDNFLFGVLTAHRLSAQLDAVGVVDQAVEDGVGVGLVCDHVVPALDGDLGGDDG